MLALELYKVTNQPNELNKTLNNPITISGVFRTEIDCIDIVVEIESNNYDYNYVFIQSLNKYYFVSNITLVNAKVTRLYLHCDVLMTYKTDILASFGLVTKGGNINPYYSNVESDSRQDIRRIAFPYYFNTQNASFVLVTISGSGVE